MRRVASYRCSVRRTASLRIRFSSAAFFAAAAAVSSACFAALASACRALTSARVSFLDNTPGLTPPSAPLPRRGVVGRDRIDGRDGRDLVNKRSDETPAAPVRVTAGGCAWLLGAVGCGGGGGFAAAARRASASSMSARSTATSVGFTVDVRSAVMTHVRACASHVHGRVVPAFGAPAGTARTAVMASSARQSSGTIQQTWMSHRRQVKASRSRR